MPEAYDTITPFAYRSDNRDEAAAEVSNALDELAHQKSSL
jgi:hypothetical protein